MDFLKNAEEALNGIYNNLTILAQEDRDNRVRLNNKARGVAKAIEALKIGARQHPNSKLALNSAMGILRTIINESGDTAYREGLVEGLNAINQKYPH